MRKRGGFVTELGIAVLIASVVGIAVLLATGELGAAWDALRDDQETDIDVADDGSELPSPSPEGSSIAAVGIRPGVEYMDVNHISEDLTQKGVVCEDANVHLEDKETQTGTCVSATGAEVTIFVYLRAAAAPASFEPYIDLTEGSLLEGPNWYLGSTDTEFLTGAQEIVGGVMREL